MFDLVLNIISPEWRGIHVNDAPTRRENGLWLGRAGSKWQGLLPCQRRSGADKLAWKLRGHAHPDIAERGPVIAYAGAALPIAALAPSARTPQGATELQPVSAP